MKKIIISSAAVLSVAVLTGCGTDNLSQEAQDNATKQTEKATVAVQDTNDAYVESQSEIAEIKKDAAQDIASSTKETVKDATKDIADIKQDQVKQDASALAQVAQAAGAKYTSAVLTTYMNTAAESVGPNAEAMSIENTSKKDNTTFVVEVKSMDGSTQDVYLDATGTVVATQ